MAAAADNPRYWMMLGGSMLVQELLYLSFNYAKLPKELRNSLWTVLSHPLYRFIDSTFGTLAFLRALFIGIPGLHHTPSIARRIEEQTLPEPNSLLPSSSFYSYEKDSFYKQGYSEATTNDTDASRYSDEEQGYNYTESLSL